LHTHFNEVPGSKRPLGVPRIKWADTIKMDVKEIACKGVDWIEVALDRVHLRVLVKAVMNLRVP
jgi:hypothetical protein